MAAAKREEMRQLLLSQGWVINQLFSSRPASEGQLESFIRTGIAGDAINTKEPRTPEVDEMVAKILANNGRLVIEEMT